jgi:adenosylmethionine-8-amino-7-oxononanoate aminotransferase
MPSSRDPYPHLWFPFTWYQDVLEFPPLVIERGSGVWLEDSKGRRYLDAAGSWWTSLLGHGNPEIIAAVKEQAGRLEHVMMAGFVTRPAIELSELLISIAPGGLSRVFYSDDGSTAVEAALKMALQYWSLKGKRRAKFISLSGAYHGDTLGATSVGAISQYHGLFHEVFGGHLQADGPYCYRCPVNKCKDTCGAECMDSLATLIGRQSDAIAACIFEPMVQGAAGMRVYPAKVLTRIFELCRSSGILTIADEVFTGFGRTGTMFACAHAAQTPDIMCVAKGLTGGFLPMAATLVREEFFSEFCGTPGSDRIFHYGHSYTGNPIAAAAACAALSIIKRENIPESAAAAMRHFEKRLREFIDLPIVGDIRALGMIGALELVRDRRTKEKLPAEKRIAFNICRRALSHGLIIRPLGDVIYFVPSLTITADEIDTMFSMAHKAIHEVLDAEIANT